jgi:hypothetical protein
MMQVIKSWFAFPDGGVWSNLIASFIWAVPTFIHLHKKIDRNHEKIREIHEGLERGKYNVRTRPSK